MNKLIVVTGGTKGIGKAVIEKFAANGFDALTCSRDTDNLEKLKNELNKKYHTRIYTYRADLSINEQTLAFVEYTRDIKRKIDVLVNNAGIFVPGAVHSEPEGNLELMMANNLFSAYHVTRGILPLMLEKKQGHIFNICSTASIVPYVNGGSYCISKFAMLGMTRVLREEMKPHGIRVTAIIPGATLTDSWAGTDLPKSRFMKPEDVAAALYNAYTLSDHSVVEELLIRPQLGDI